MRKSTLIIIAYIIYASIVLIVIADESGHNFWEPFLGWIITVPSIIAGGYCLWKYYYGPSEELEDDVCTTEENTFQSPLFVEDWTLLDFARIYGKMQTGTFTNNVTEEVSKVCVFTKNGNKTYVYFYPQLGELSPSEISQRKESLKVGKTAEGELYLHEGGDSLLEDVDLNLDEN